MGGTETSAHESPHEESLTPTELDAAAKRAADKLSWIISREGDANGDRRKPEYFMELVTEAIKAIRLSKYLVSLSEEKEKDCPRKTQGNPNQKQPHYSMAH